MKKYFVILLLASVILDAQTKDTKKTIDSSKSKNILVENKMDKDSIIISISQLNEIVKVLKKDEDNNNLFKNLFPSIVALIVVAISTWGAIHLGKKQINVQKKLGEEQLRSQEAQSQEQLNVSREQIQETSNTTIKQINSENRQNWIIDTRNTISELIAQANLLNIEFQENIPNIDKRKMIHEKFIFNKNKLSLLLNPDKDKHNLLLESLKELLEILDAHMINSNFNNDSNSTSFYPFDNNTFLCKTNKIIENGRNLLYDEWSKIQS